MSETTQKGRSTAAKILMPIVAAAASAFASQLAKKAPQYLEQAVKPKLRETKEAVVGGGDGSDGGAAASRSNDELEQRRRERAQHRAARRKAS